MLPHTPYPNSSLYTCFPRSCLLPYLRPHSSHLLAHALLTHSHNHFHLTITQLSPRYYSTNALAYFFPCTYIHFPRYPIQFHYKPLLLITHIAICPTFFFISFAKNYHNISLIFHPLCPLAQYHHQHPTLFRTTISPTNWFTITQITQFTKRCTHRSGRATHFPSHYSSYKHMALLFSSLVRMSGFCQGWLCSPSLQHCARVSSQPPLLKHFPGRILGYLFFPPSSYRSIILQCAQVSSKPLHSLVAPAWVPLVDVPSNPRLCRHLLHIYQQQCSVWVHFGDMPSHPRQCKPLFSSIASSHPSFLLTMASLSILQQFHTSIGRRERWDTFHFNQKELSQREAHLSFGHMVSTQFQICNGLSLIRLVDFVLQGLLCNCYIKALGIHNKASKIPPFLFL